MKSGFFQQLRTEQQLGYVASAFAWPQLEVPGLVMLIQSPVADAAKWPVRWSTLCRPCLRSLDEAQFARHKAALLSDILRPDKNLSERADFYWQSIATQAVRFRWAPANGGCREILHLEQWRAYYQRVFLEQRHSLQVVAPGTLEDPAPKVTSPV